MIIRSPRHKSLLLGRLLAAVVVCLIILPASDSVGQMIDRERVEAEIERTDEIISQAQAQLRGTNDSRVAMLLRQAIVTQERAREALEGRRFGAALEFTRKARELAQRAIGQLVRSDEDKAFVEQQLERTDEVLEEAGALAMESKQPVYGCIWRRRFACRIVPVTYTAKTIYGKLFSLPVVLRSWGAKHSSYSTRGNGSVRRSGAISSGVKN